MGLNSEALSQLRSSHFWLVLVSCGLLIVPSLPLNTGYRNAYKQVSELMNINSTLSAATLATTFGTMRLGANAELDVGRIAGGAAWHFGPTPCRYLASDRPGSGSPPSSRVVWMGMPDDTAAYGVPYQFPKSLSRLPAERTLAEVMQIWAFLDNGGRAFVIDRAAPPGTSGSTDLDVGPPGFTAWQLPNEFSCTVGNLEWVSAQRSSPSQQYATLVLGGELRTRNVGPGGIGETGGSSNFQGKELAVHVETIDLPLFSAQLQRFFGQSDPAAIVLAGQSFSDVFPDLVRVSAGLESLTLRELRAYTERMMDEGMTDVGVFGAELPIDIFMLWGVPLLLVMQLYFHLHLRTLTSGEPRGARGSQFPWIALYPGLSSRVVTFCSLALAPVSAGSLVYFAAKYGFVGKLECSVLAAGVVASAALVCVTELALGAFHENRDRLRS